MRAEMPINHLPDLLDWNTSCCEKIENHSICEEKILCRICGGSIDNICQLPDKIYDNKLQSHHGMPVSEL